MERAASPVSRTSLAAWWLRPPPEQAHRAAGMPAARWRYAGTGSRAVAPSRATSSVPPAGGRARQDDKLERRSPAEPARSIPDRAVTCCSPRASLNTLPVSCALDPRQRAGLHRPARRRGAAAVRDTGRRRLPTLLPRAKRAEPAGRPRLHHGRAARLASPKAPGSTLAGTPSRTGMPEARGRHAGAARAATWVRRQTSWLCRAWGRSTAMSMALPVAASSAVAWSRRRTGWCGAHLLGIRRHAHASAVGLLARRSAALNDRLCRQPCRPSLPSSTSIRPSPGTCPRGACRCGG